MLEPEPGEEMHGERGAEASVYPEENMIECLLVAIEGDISILEICRLG